MKCLKFQAFHVMPGFELQAFHKMPKSDAQIILVCLLLLQVFKWPVLEVRWAYQEDVLFISAGSAVPPPKV